jgi:DNA-binding NarL/FixJ family response regulator
MSVRIVLVGDLEMMRDGLKAILRQVADFEVVGEAALADSLAVCISQLPDVVIMDVGSSIAEAIDATSKISEQVREANVVILSTHDSEEAVLSAMQAGARAFMLKSASDVELLDAIRTVAKGQTYLKTRVSERLLECIQGGLCTSDSQNQGLTPREVQVLQLLVQGRSNKEVAAILELSFHTVRCYRQTLMRKLGATNVAGLAHLAFASGIANIAQAA